MLIRMLRALRPLLAAPLLLAMPAHAADTLPYKPLSVLTPDGLRIAAQEWGNPSGPEIVFIHGYSQSHLSWTKQVSDEAMAREFRIITYDLRGHGGSDKPLDPQLYKDSRRWSDELKAVMDAFGLKRPVLVGWSYAGRVISDYLATEGPGRLAGINYVAAATKAVRARDPL